MTIAADVAVLLGRAITASELTRVDRLVEMAQGAVESALPGFSFATGDETVDVRAHGNELWTPRYPVTAINGVSLGDAVLGSTSFEWTDRGRLTFGVRSVLNDFEIETSPAWRSPGPYTVDYDYGFEDADLPADIASAVAGLVATALRQQATNPDNVASETLGAYSVTYGTGPDRAGVNAGIGSTESLRYQLRRWRRTVQVSVPLET